MRHLSETVHVRCAGGAVPAPAQFLWRGRFYVVRDVLARWRERSSWWEQAGVAAVHGEGDGVPSSFPGGALDLEREVWRVEASPGRTGVPGVYDLCRPAPAGSAGSPAPLDEDTWHLLRVSD